MIAKNFRVNIPHSHIIQKHSEYCPIEKPPKKLLEQVRDFIHLKYYFYKNVATFTQNQAPSALLFLC
jgi:hypothetical protein